MGLVARALGLERRRFGGGQLLAQLGEPHLEARELLAPRFHLPRRKRQVDGEAARHDLGVPLGALALPRQAAHLARHLVDQVVQPLQIARRLLEAAFRRAATIAIEADARRLLEQLAPIVGTIGEQRVDHLALDHDAGAGAEPRATQQVGDVAQAAGRAVEEVVAVARAREPARDHDFLERDGEDPLVVREVQRDFGHVHRTPRRRALEDHLVHLRAAHEARALLAEHPAHGVGHVRLAASVRTDDRRHARLEHQMRGVREGLEAVELELGQTH